MQRKTASDFESKIRKTAIDFESKIRKTENISHSITKMQHLIQNV